MLFDFMANLNSKQNGFCRLLLLFVLSAARTSTSDASVLVGEKHRGGRRSGDLIARRGRGAAPVFHPVSETIANVHVLLHAPEGVPVPKPLPTSEQAPAAPAPPGLNGVFVLLHACARTSRDFFELPEEREMILAVLRRGFLVVAPDNAPNPANCWIPQADTALVSGMILELRKSRSLTSLPLYGVGISNGGLVLNNMAYYGIPFDGLHLNVALPPAQPRTGLPPTSFVVMQSDTYAPVDKIRQYAQETREHSETPVQVIEVVAKPLSALASRIQAIGFSAEASQRLIQQILEWGWHKEEAGISYLPFFTADQVLTRLSIDPSWQPLVAPLAKALQEELHVIEGVHGATSERFEQSLDFILDPHHIKAAPGQAPTSNAQSDKMLTCDHYEATEGNNGSVRSQRSLSLPQPELEAIRSDPSTFTGMISYLCACLRLQVVAAPANTMSTSITSINGTIKVLATPRKISQADAKLAALASLKAAKNEACRGQDLAMSCWYCRQRDPFAVGMVLR